MSGSVAVEKPLPPLSVVEPQSLDEEATFQRIADIVEERIKSRLVCERTLPLYTTRGGSDEPSVQTTEVVEHGPSTESVDSHPTSSQRNESSLRAGSYVEREQPEAGPSVPYRRSLRLGNSTTSFIDVTDSITNISEHPVSGGGYCDVHMADMTGEGKVALKKLRLLGNSEKAKKRFRYEAEIWIRLDHPNVLRFFGICQTGPTLYMVSPWQDNGHMTAYFSAHPNASRLQFLTQVADALSFLHSNDPKVIHGDVKGQNVLVSYNGDALLCDFGLSMILSEMSFISGVPTGVGDGGSIRWLAPELMQGSVSKTEYSDVFAYALLVVEGITGNPPFHELVMDAAVINAVINGQRPDYPFKGINPLEEARLWRLLQLCWHPTVHVRPSIHLVRTVMHSLHLRSESAGTLDGLPQAFITYVMLGECTLDEYTKPLRSGLDVGRNSLRSPQQRSSAVITSHNPRPGPCLWSRIQSLPSVFKFTFALSILVYILTACAIALNIVLFSFFRQFPNPIFRRVTTILGLASWAWLLVVIEPLVCLRYLNVLLGFGRLSSFLGLIPRRVWLTLRISSWFACVTNTVFAIVASSSVSFANHTRFHNFLISYNALSIAVMLLTPVDIVIILLSRWRSRRRIANYVVTHSITIPTVIAAGPEGHQSFQGASRSFTGSEGIGDAAPGGSHSQPVVKP